jgi:hypothetical protein
VAKSNPPEIRWHRSSASGASECVEVAFFERGVKVRHSQDPAGPVLTFSQAEWRAFLVGVHRGEFRGKPAHSGMDATGASEDSLLY